MRKAFENVCKVCGKRSTNVCKAVEKNVCEAFGNVREALVKRPDVFVKRT